MHVLLIFLSFILPIVFAIYRHSRAKKLNIKDSNYGTITIISSIAIFFCMAVVSGLTEPKAQTTESKPTSHKTKRKSKSEKEFEKKMDKIAKKQDKEFNSKKSSSSSKSSKKTGVPSNKSLRKQVQKEHLTTLKKQLSSLDSEKYGGDTIDSINVMGSGHIEVTFTKSFIKQDTKDERTLIQKSIVDDISDAYNRLAPYPGNISKADIVFFDTDGNGYGIWDTDGNKEGE